MIFQTYKTLAEANATSLADIFTYVGTEVPMFVPMLLFFWFMIVFLGSYTYQLRRTGYHPLFSSLAVASFMTTILATLFAFIPNFVAVPYLLISFVLTIVFVAILLTMDTED